MALSYFGVILLTIFANNLSIEGTKMSGPSSVIVNSKYFSILCESPSIRFASVDEESLFRTEFKKQASLLLDSAKNKLETKILSVAKKHDLHLQKYKQAYNDAYEDLGANNSVADLSNLLNGYYDETHKKAFSIFIYRFSLPIPIAKGISQLRIAFSPTQLPSKENLDGFEHDIISLLP